VISDDPERGPGPADLRVPGDRSTPEGLLRQLTTVTLRLDPYWSERGPTQNYMDLRLGKSFNLTQHRVVKSAWMWSTR